jgi:hypothetical protein
MELSITANRRSLGKGGILDVISCRRLGCCQCCRCGGGNPDVDDADSTIHGGVVSRRGRFVPSFSGVVAPQPQRSRRWSIQARFLPSNVREAGRLDDDVRSGIMIAALGHRLGGPMSMAGQRFFGGSSAVESSAADLSAAAEEAARKDPGLVLFDVLQVRPPTRSSFALRDESGLCQNGMQRFQSSCSTLT